MNEKRMMKILKEELEAWRGDIDPDSQWKSQVQSEARDQAFFVAILKAMKRVAIEVRAEEGI